MNFLCFLISFFSHALPPSQFYWNSIFKYLDAVCGCWVLPQILHHHYRYRPCFASFSWKNILFEIIANCYSMMFFLLQSNMLLKLLTFFSSNTFFNGWWWNYFIDINTVVLFTMSVSIKFCFVTLTMKKFWNLRLWSLL